MIKVNDCMTRNPKVVRSSGTIAEAMELMREHQFRHLPVVDVDDPLRLVGILSERDIHRAAPSRFLVPGPRDVEDFRNHSVWQIMVRHPVTVRPDDPITWAMMLFVEKKFGALPVVDDARLVGILSQIDALRVLLPLARQGE